MIKILNFYLSNIKIKNNFIFYLKKLYQDFFWAMEGGSSGWEDIGNSIIQRNKILEKQSPDNIFFTSLRWITISFESFHIILRILLLNF